MVGFLRKKKSTTKNALSSEDYGLNGTSLLDADGDATVGTLYAHGISTKKQVITRKETEEDAPQNYPYPTQSSVPNTNYGYNQNTIPNPSQQSYGQTNYGQQYPQPNPSQYGYNTSQTNANGPYPQQPIPNARNIPVDGYAPQKETKKKWFSYGRKKSSA